MTSVGRKDWKPHNMATILPNSPLQPVKHRPHVVRLFRKPLISRSKTDKHTEDCSTTRNDHDNSAHAYDDGQLQERADLARTKQDAWLNDILEQSRFLESTTRALELQIGHEREQIRRQESETYRAGLEQRQALVARETERRQAELIQQRRTIEQAGETRRLQLEAEAEWRRLEAEEAERRRRERERECAVCLDVNDMENMIEVPCRHWYCRDHLRGEH